MPEIIKIESTNSDGLLRRGQPRYFHIWEEDPDDLQPILIAIRDRRIEVVDYWYRLYVLHFGNSRSL